MSKQVPTDTIGCQVKDKILETNVNQTPLGFGTPLPSAPPFEPLTTLEPSAPPLPENVYNEDLNRNTYGGGKKHIPKRLNKDGTSHKKYNFKLA